MKILHTSDWHLGQSFMGKSREDEHIAFLSWLLQKIKDEEINVLIVAGDIFDIGTPPNYALELYYDFLKNLVQTNCKYTIITAGNHDSVSNLKAPKQLLAMLNISIIASGEEDEIIEIYNNSKLEGVICAVPFLRDSVVRRAIRGESSKDKDKSLTDGIREHYQSVYNRAKDIVRDSDIPIVATGHLTTVGAKISDSERDIYIGGSVNIDSSFFGEYFNYVALGHLHNNQKVGSNHIRYSGSPIPLSFSEADRDKRVNIVSFKENIVIVKEVTIPITKNLIVIKGNLNLVIEELEKIENKTCWIEIHLDDENPIKANREIKTLAKSLDLTILVIKMNNSTNALDIDKNNLVPLEQKTPLDIFNLLLRSDKVYDDDKIRDELVDSFKIILEELEEIV